MTVIHRFITMLVFILAAGFISGQGTGILLTDSHTGEPVPFAHVCFEEIETGREFYGLTAEDGSYIQELKGKAILAISCIGYQTLYDTVYPGKSYSLLFEPSIESINEVVVTAQYAPKRADQSIYKVQVINSMQIERRASPDLTGVLDNELGIRISQDGALGSSMSLQGLSGEHVKFLVDGVPVIGRMNGNIDISQLNLYNVEHIEVIEGPMSVVYGSNALAGAVNLISRDNRGERFMAQANTYLESVGTYNFDGLLKARFDKHTVQVSGGRNFFDGFSPVDTTRTKRWKPKRQIFGDASYSFKTSGTKVRTSFSYFNENLEAKGEPLEPYGARAFDSYFITSRMTARADIDKNWSGKRYWNTILSWSYYDRRKNTYFKDLTNLEKNLTVNPGDHDTTTFQDFLLRSTYSKSNDDVRLNYQAGIDLEHETGEGKRIKDGRQDIGNYAAFLSLQWEPAAGLLLQPGVRAIYNTRYKAPLVYSLNLKWDPLEVLTFRVSMARGFRAPSLKELYLYFVDVNHDIRGNEELTSENSYNFNASATVFRENKRRYYSAELKVFYNIINNVIELVEEDPAEMIWTYVNIDQKRTKGIQFKANYRLYPSLNLQAGAGVTGRYNSFYEVSSNDGGFRYSPSATGAVTYSIPKTEVDLNVSYKYTGKLPYLTLAGEDVVEGYIEQYHNMDITASRRFFSNNLFVSLGVKNLFDNKDLKATAGASSGVHTGGASGSVPVGWGRTFFLRVSYTFKKFGS
jgi:outer membrane receptor for ferrienterochelin and colicins